MFKETIKISQTERKNLSQNFIQLVINLVIYKRVFKAKVKKLQKRHNVYVCFHHQFNIPVAEFTFGYHKNVD